MSVPKMSIVSPDFAYRITLFIPLYLLFPLLIQGIPFKRPVDC